MTNYQQSAGPSAQLVTRYTTLVLATFLYWSTSVFSQSTVMVCWPTPIHQKTIQCHDQNTGEVDDLVYSTNWVPGHIEFDENQGKIYWSLHSREAGHEFLNMRILRADLDGTNVDTLTSGEIGPEPKRVLFDLPRQKVYWTTEDGWEKSNLGNYGIFRANFDGTGIEKIVEVRAFAIALDRDGQKIYWGTSTKGWGGHRGRHIYRSDLDGSDTEALFSSEVTELAVDPTSGKLYGIQGDWGSQSIFRANLDGSDREVLVPAEGTTCASLKLHLATNKMYWYVSDRSQYPEGIIKRANLDGSDVETVGSADMDWNIQSFGVGMSPSSVAVEPEVAIPGSHVLNPAYPNPFNPSTTIRYSLESTEQISIKVRDGLGRIIAVLLDEVQPAGTHQVAWTADRDTPSGVYFYTMETGSGAVTRSMLLLR